jgi:hypothetical protein
MYILRALACVKPGVERPSASDRFAAPRAPPRPRNKFANLAQLVEQRIRNAQVTGSNPVVGSSHFLSRTIRPGTAASLPGRGSVRSRPSRYRPPTVAPWGHVGRDPADHVGCHRCLHRASRVHAHHDRPIGCRPIRACYRRPARWLAFRQRCRPECRQSARRRAHQLGAPLAEPVAWLLRRCALARDDVGHFHGDVRLTGSGEAWCRDRLWVSCDVFRCAGRWPGIALGYRSTG